MEEILLNLANISAINFCKENNIDCSNTHIAKNGRGFKYSLLDNTTGRARITVQFNKHSVPTHFFHRNYNT